MQVNRVGIAIKAVKAFAICIVSCKCTCSNNTWTVWLASSLYAITEACGFAATLWSPKLAARCVSEHLLSVWVIWISAGAPSRPSMIEINPWLKQKSGRRSALLISDQSRRFYKQMCVTFRMFHWTGEKKPLNDTKYAGCYLYLEGEGRALCPVASSVKWPGSHLPRCRYDNLTETSHSSSAQITPACTSHPAVSWWVQSAEYKEITFSYYYWINHQYGIKNKIFIIAYYSSYFYAPMK